MSHLSLRSAHCFIFCLGRQSPSFMERETGLEPATSCLEGSRSKTERFTLPNASFQSPDNRLLISSSPYDVFYFISCWRLGAEIFDNSLPHLFAVSFAFHEIVVDSAALQFSSDKCHHSPLLRVQCLPREMSRTLLKIAVLGNIDNLLVLYIIR